MNNKLKAPNGNEITGTKEILVGEAYIQDLRLVDGKVEYDHSGETEVFWDCQQTATEKNQTIFIDEDGGEWLESQLIESE